MTERILQLHRWCFLSILMHFAHCSSNNIPYASLFSACVKNVVTNLPIQTVLPHLEFTQTKLWLERDNLRHGNSPRLKIRPLTTSRQKGRKENKANISLFTVIPYIFIIMVNKVKPWSLHGIDTAVMNMNPPCDDFCFLILPPFCHISSSISQLHLIHHYMNSC